MKHVRGFSRFLLAALLAGLAASPLVALAPTDAPTLAIARAPRDGSAWLATWGCSPQPAIAADLPAGGLADTTLRQVIRVSRGGRQLRLRLSNSFGISVLRISAVTLALSAGEGRVQPESLRPLTFSGVPAVAIPAGALVVSDPLSFDLPPLALVTITLHLPEAPDSVTLHQGSRTTSYVSHGNVVSLPELPDPVKIDHWYFISGLEVLSERREGVVVILGDSIADGRGSTTNHNNRWPDRLAERLQRAMPGVGVVNQGIGGNRLLRDGLGPNALARLDRDVLAQPGAAWLIVSEGINDLGSRIKARQNGEAFVSRAEIIAAYEQIIVRARSSGLRILGGTLLPCGGSQYDVPDVEADRVAINEWIRTSGAFDAVVDFDAALRDPQNPTRLQAEYDSGDHLHPSPAGFERMAAEVPCPLPGGRAIAGDAVVPDALPRR